MDFLAQGNYHLIPKNPETANAQNLTPLIDPKGMQGISEDPGESKSNQTSAPAQP